MDILQIGIITIIFIMLLILTHFIGSRILKRSRILKIANLEIATKSNLVQVVFKTKADRCLILKLHNGGGKLQVGVDKYFSIIEEVNTAKVADIKEDYQQIKVDSEYMSMINKLITEGMYIFDIKKLPPGILKRRYELDGIKSGVIFSIEATDYGFYYGSFSSTSEIDEFIGTKEYALVELEVNKLRNLYRAARKANILH